MAAAESKSFGQETMQVLNKRVRESWLFCTWLHSNDAPGIVFSSGDRKEVLERLLRLFVSGHLSSGLLKDFKRWVSRLPKREAS